MMELFEALCHHCDVSFDVYGASVGDYFEPEDADALVCPGCLMPVWDVEKKESLA